MIFVHFSSFNYPQALNHTVTWLLGGHHHHHHHLHDEPHHANETRKLSSVSHNADNNNEQRAETTGESENKNQQHAETMGEQENIKQQSMENEHTIQEKDDSDHGKEHDGPHVESVCACCAEDPAGDLRNIQNMAAEIESFEAQQHQHWEGAQRPRTHPKDGDESDDEDDAGNNLQPNNDSSEHETKKLMRMSLNTALAIGLHNFPEGLATFVAALSDPSVGAVLAVAIR